MGGTLATNIVAPGVNNTTMYKHILNIEPSLWNTIPVLNVGERMGDTGYIDYIKDTEVTSPVMKGVDSHSRDFFTIKGEILVNNGDTYPVFETFFRRYTEGNTWMGCGHYGVNFMDTTGGMEDEQGLIIDKLISNKSIELDSSTTHTMRMPYNLTSIFEKKNVTPVLLRLVNMEPNGEVVNTASV